MAAGSKVRTGCDSGTMLFVMLPAWTGLFSWVIQSCNSVGKKSIEICELNVSERKVSPAKQGGAVFGISQQAEKGACYQGSALDENKRRNAKKGNNSGFMYSASTLPIGTQSWTSLHFLLRSLLSPPPAVGSC